MTLLSAVLQPFALTCFIRSTILGIDGGIVFSTCPFICVCVRTWLHSEAFSDRPPVEFSSFFLFIYANK